MKDLWKAAFPVGTEWYNLDAVYNEYNWDFKSLQEALEEGGILYGKTVFAFGTAEPQLLPDNNDVHKIVHVPAVVVIQSPFPPSDKLAIRSLDRKFDEIIPMNQMKMEWVPYIPSEHRDRQVDKMDFQIFSLVCKQSRDAFRHMNEDDVKKFHHCLPYFYQPFEEDELEQSTLVEISFPSEQPVECDFDWEFNKLEEFVDRLIEEGTLSAEQKTEFKEFVIARVRAAMKAKREAREARIKNFFTEARMKIIEEMSEETKQAFKNIKFYKFYPQSSPDVPEFKTAPFINRYYGNAHQVL